MTSPSERPLCSFFPTISFSPVNLYKREVVDSFDMPRKYLVSINKTACHHCIDSTLPPLTHPLFCLGFHSIYSSISLLPISFQFINP
ncbi:hypothetical protein L6452_17298 [Arctium lappa]|uniref:Uncharacterized protein n=1 Tax=Arctium lappa TaxID=4217 RepID=A0ACB9C309_ARCLA|nr:hypothetical protein L6452_17298 [Arctium lappa]